MTDIRWDPRHVKTRNKRKPTKLQLIRWLVDEGETVQKGTPLFMYEWQDTQESEGETKTPKQDTATTSDTIERARTHRAEVMAEKEAVVDRLVVDQGRLPVPLTPNMHLMTLTEPCTHAVQLHGLCALCGKDMSA